MTLLTYKTKNRDKGITRITYNNIGLVDSILFDTGAKVLYTYGINGEKLRVRHFAATSNMVSPLSHSAFLPISPGIDTFSYDEEEYIGGDFVVYGSVSRGASVVPSYKYYFGDGYISQDPVFLIGAGSTASYHYYSKDHLGNVRSVVTKSTFTNAVTEVQKTHYYPFGGIIADLSTGRSEQNRLYNGKELDTSNNLWWYDYGARQYDPTAPRFTTADPLAEKYYGWNMYGYCVNNPVMFVDPDGRAFGDYYDIKGNFLTTDGIDDGKKYLVLNADEAKSIKKTKSVSNINSAMIAPTIAQIEKGDEIIKLGKKLQLETGFVMGNGEASDIVTGTRNSIILGPQYTKMGSSAENDAHYQPFDLQQNGSEVSFSTSEPSTADLNMRRIRENNGLNNALNPSWVIGEELNGRIEQDANTKLMNISTTTSIRFVRNDTVSSPIPWNRFKKTVKKIYD